MTNLFFLFFKKKKLIFIAISLALSYDDICHVRNDVVNSFFPRKAGICSLIAVVGGRRFMLVPSIDIPTVSLILICLIRSFSFFLLPFRLKTLIRLYNLLNQSPLVYKVDLNSSIFKSNL